jgi:transposase InsO family protein
MSERVIYEHLARVRLACQAFKISEKCYRYNPKLSSDNGSEYISHALREWVETMDIELMYIYNHGNQHRKLI